MNYHVDTLLDLALNEDIGTGDLTSEAIFPTDTEGLAYAVAKEDLVFSGQFMINKLLLRLDGKTVYIPYMRSGTKAKKGDKLFEVRGCIRKILTVERTLLNFIQHFSGIATLTRKFTEIAEPYGVKICDTRKTMPGYRVFEKKAVRDGGGANHRMGLFDGVMIKDNHIDFCGSISAAVEKVRAVIPHTIRVEVEARTMDEVREAMDAGADIILLDNMTLDGYEEAIKFIDKRVLVEISGGVNLDNLESYCKLEPDIISTGYITHSARSMDISLKVLK
ncbi:carboxylating nicotinate-nucleotide diphosphorylase [Desulfurispira natronophila]|uniref:Probable nicotinate-nucleotide pyrophosphorylase [carboxylating] n=1 Tax=Desulfurispira natronophila TaxID=682562 RepID=A0A7W7Y307_9BACT|nr:carboxylating nicotinate-nucleotide diphosphorylase [Desulfurispira natronophila]MBB5021160.1 nicotinate-nucleotide pyrophosphorylase (carboxylating) [Desulfurispira natronophila]